MTAPGGQMRLFFAVPLAEPLRMGAVQLQRQLAAASPARVKWVEPENLHLTLKFVGDTAATRLEEFVAVARQVGRDASPCELEYCGVGCFAARGCPRVIWLGLRAQPPELVALAGALDAALARAGLAEPDQRPFHAHVTLGRVREGPGGRELLQAVRGLAEAPVGGQRLDSFVLVSSELTRSGPIYTEQASFALGV